MKNLFRSMLFVIMFVVAMVAGAFAADVAAVAPVVVPTAVAVPSTFQAVINWMANNQVVVGFLLIAILDFIFAINPEWKANGILHFIYVAAQKKNQAAAPPATPPV